MHSSLSPRRQLARTGLHVSTLGLGCVVFGREIDLAASRQVLRRALDAGINLCDTSESYAEGASEMVLGQLLRQFDARADMVICTKVRDDLSYERVLRAAEDSMRRLRTDYLDIFLLHRFDPTTPLEEPLRALDQLVRQGKVRHIGCSNFSVAQLRSAATIQEQAGWRHFEVVEMIYNLVAREGEAEILPHCCDNNVGLLSYSPLGAGFLTGKYDRERRVAPGLRFAVKPGHQRIYFKESSFAVLDCMHELARETGLGLPEMALRWCFSRPLIDCFLVGARTPAHIDQALEAWRERGQPAAIMERLELTSRPAAEHLPGGAPALKNYAERK